MRPPQLAVASLSRDERERIIRPLLRGMVPHSGFEHFVVGRETERDALAEDRATAANGRAGVRFVMGRQGSGKTLLLKSNAAEARAEGFATTLADMSYGRRLHGREGQARALYMELVRNLSTRSSPDGNALVALLDRFVLSCRDQAEETGTTADAAIVKALCQLSDTTAGYDFREVVRTYWRGYDTGDDALMDAAVRWLRGEYTSKIHARKTLDVRTIIDDRGVWDALKALAVLVRLAGSPGLLVCIDELGSFLGYGQPARSNNSAEILRIVNDCVSGTATGITVVFAGIPKAIEDERQGLFADPALKSRLSANPYAKPGMTDTSSPVLDLKPISDAQAPLLLERLTDLYACLDTSARLLSPEQITRLLLHFRSSVAGTQHSTARDLVRSYLSILVLLEQNPEATLEDLLDRQAPKLGAASERAVAPPGSKNQQTDNSDNEAEDEDEDRCDELSGFQL